MLALFILTCSCYGVTEITLTVSSAASLKDALAETEASYQRVHSDVRFANNLGASGALAAQIDQGAPVDIFLSASTRNMDDLAAKGMIIASTRRNLWRNTLVLIAPLDSKLQGFQGLADDSVRSIAVGDPGSVPAGIYGRQTLTALHLQDSLRAKYVLANDVRQVLTYVETGNADAGLVYATDARTSNRVRVVAMAPESTHDPIVYPAAIITGSHNIEAARKFIDYLRTATVQAIFVKHGFTIATQ